MSIPQRDLASVDYFFDPEILQDPYPYYDHVTVAPLVTEDVVGRGGTREEIVEQLGTGVIVHDVGHPLRIHHSFTSPDWLSPLGHTTILPTASRSRIARSAAGASSREYRADTCGCSAPLARSASSSC